MILLTGSSSLRVYLGAAATTNQLPIVATYIDSNNTTFNPLAVETQTNGTNPVVVIDPPASGLSRQLKYLSILNTDTVTNDVYVEYHTSSSDRRLFKQAITTNQKIEYVDSEGFEVIPGAFINVTGDAVTGVPFITHGSTALLGNYRIAAARSGISIINDPANGGNFSFGLSGNMYQDITGHTGDLSQHLTGLSVSNQLLDQTLVWNTTGWVNKYAHAVVYATNAEIDTLNVGEVVYLSGAQGDRASVRRASNLYENTSSKTVGMVSQAITSNSPGPVVTLGYVEKLNLAAYSPGDVLWLGDTPGTFTKTKPSAPNHLVFIGVVARANAGNGIAFIRTQNGYELEELHDVKLSTGNLVSGNFLGWNGLYWTNTGLNTGFISGFNEGVQDVIANTLYATSGLAIIYNDSTDQIFISGERATATTLGLASFNNGNFSVNSGAVSISAVPTGTVTNLNLAIKDQIGNSGFFEYRGGITGYWNQGSRTLTLDMFSGAGGAGSTTLDGLVDVDVPAPVSGNYLHYNGATWIANSIRTGDIANLTEHTQDVIAASLAATSGLAILYNDTAGTITISGQRASNTATFTGIGLAGFNATFFAVASGIVSITGGIQTGQIVGYGVTTGQVSNLSEAIQDTVAASLASTSGLAILYDDAAGTITISGQRATTAAPGLAIFSATNFSVSSGLALITGGLQTGFIVSLPQAITATVSSAVGLDDLSGIYLGTMNSGEYLFFNGTGWTGNSIITEAFSAMKLPNGHESRDASTLSFDEPSRTFSITPVGASFSFWTSGRKYTKTTAQSISIPDTTGLYYFYFNRDGALAYKNTYFDFENDVHTAYVYWNSTNDKAYYFADERHGTTMDWQTHEYLHRTRGAAYANGFGVTNYNLSGDGSSDAHAKLDIANGTFFDEDIEVIITHSASPAANSWQQILQGNARIPIFYLSGDSWVKDVATEFPLKQGVNTAQYNLLSGAIWTGVDLSGSQPNQTGYGITWVVATNNLNSPILGILGQAAYTGLGSAEAVVWTDVNLPGFPIFEFRPLYKVIYEAYSGYTNTVSTRFKSIVDLRVSQSVAGGVPATPVSDHGSLVGLSDDDHPQYSRTDGTRAFSGPVAGISPLNTSDLTTRDYVDARTQYATTTNSGIAYFDSNFFSVTNGLVSISEILITDLSDTAVTAPASGQALVYDGNVWRNSGLSTGNIFNLVEAIQDTVVSSISTTTGIAIVYSDSTNQIILSGQRASTSAIGLAAFDSNNFTVSSGLVSIAGGIQTGQIVGYGVTTGQVSNLAEAIQDVAAASLVTTSGLAVIYDDTNGSITISGQRATTSSIGLAAFDSSNFAVSSGLVSISTIQTGQISNYGVTTGQISNLGEAVQDIVAATLSTTSGLAIIYDDAQSSIIISGQRATTSNPGLAFFDSNNFTVSSGLVSISSIQTGQITNYGVTTGQITSLPEAIQDVVAAALLTTTGLYAIYNDTNGTITLSGQRATTTDLGIASFSSTNFTVSSGVVSISAVPTGIITNYGVTTGQITNLPEAIQDVVAASLVTTTGLTVVYDDTNGQIILSGQRATTTTLGISYFDAANFTVNSGLVSISAIPTGIITNYGVTTGQISNLPEAIQDVVAAALVTTTGITVVYDDTNGQIILSGQRATTSTLGIASFDSNNFTVASGLVSISAITTGIITNYGVTTGQITNLAEAIQDIAAAALITTSGLAIIYPDPSNQIIISGQRATTTDIGLASFNSANFTVASGAVSISAVPTGVITNLPDAIDDTIGNSGFFVFRGGITGVWNQAGRTLTLNWISGKPSYTLDELTNVNVAAPNPGDVVYYDGAEWVALASTSLGFTTGQITNLPEAIVDQAAGALIGTTGIAILYDDANARITISGQRATTTVPGIASFSSTNFSVASGAVSISAVATGTITNLPDAVKDTVGNSGFFSYRGGLTGLWDQPTRTLTLNWISGSVGGATTLDSLTDVAVPAPVSGNYLHYDGTQWISELLRTGNILNLPNAIKDTIGNSGFFEYRGGITGIWNQGSRVLTLNWRSGSVGGGATILDDLTDVESPSPSAGDVLYYGGTVWANTQINSLAVTSLASSPTGLAMQAGVALTGRGSTTIWSDYILGRIIISGDDTSRYIRQDGTRSFTGTIAGIDPTGIYDLTTKQYVDTQDLVVFNYFSANAQPINTKLSNISSMSAAANTYILFTGVTGVVSGYASPSGQALIRNESPSGMRSTLGIPERLWDSKVKTTPEIRALDGALLVCDNTLFVPLAANTTYSIRGKAFFSTNATPDLKYAFTGVTGSEWIVNRRHLNADTTGYQAAAVDKWPPHSGARSGVFPTSTKITAATANDGAGVIEWEAMVINSGNTGIFGLVWAQNASNAAQTIVWNGSFIEWEAF